VSVAEKITTAATGDIVLPKLAAIAARVPRSRASGRLPCKGGKTAFANATLGPIPDPEITPSAPGNKPAAILPPTPVPDTSCTSLSVSPVAVMPAMKQLEVTISEITLT
jgi:hypothetical protein